MAAESRASLQALLETILNSFLDLVHCDAGSVFTVRRDESGEPVLRFEAMITRSLGVQAVPRHLRSMRLRIDDSTLAGRTALHRKPIVVNPERVRTPLTTAARVLNYTTHSMFSGPLMTPRGDLVGVVQLLNKLPPEGESAAALPFDERDLKLFEIVVGQSALAIENSLLLDEQERLMEGFVDACVQAIEARDPVTSGHSVRVATYTTRLAEAVNRTPTGPLAQVAFSPVQIRELRFAAMLHDIGKIGVKESVLQKEKKLFPHELDTISMRLRLMRAQMTMLQHTEGTDYTDGLRLLSAAWKQIVAANEPTVIDAAVSEALGALHTVRVAFGPDQFLTALTDGELRKLSIVRGSLTAEERVEIESHAQKTYEILKRIPWSRGLEQVPDIAYKHHEALDGTGYPQSVGGPAIPPQTRIMSICDIYDALRAKDRPYKPALSAERALDIVARQVKAGKLDGAYFDVFVQAAVYDLGNLLEQSPGGVAA